jgi:phosphomethylpyrimidine synthase
MVCNDEVEKEEDEGAIVIARNVKRRQEARPGVGKGLRVKANVLMGTSTDKDDSEMEMRKIAIAEAVRCDSFMDLSTGSGMLRCKRLQGGRPSGPEALE